MDYIKNVVYILFFFTTFFSHDANAWTDIMHACKKERNYVIVNCYPCRSDEEGCVFPEGYEAAPTWKCISFWTTSDHWENCFEYNWLINGLHFWPCSVDIDIGNLYLEANSSLLCAYSCSTILNLLPPSIVPYWVRFIWGNYYPDILDCINCIEPTDKCDWISCKNDDPYRKKS